MAKITATRRYRLFSEPGKKLPATPKNHVHVGNYQGGKAYTLAYPGEAVNPMRRIKKGYIIIKE